MRVSVFYCFITLACIAWRLPILNAQAVAPSKGEDILAIEQLISQERFTEALPQSEALLQKYAHTPDTNAWLQSLMANGLCLSAVHQHEQGIARFKQAFDLLERQTNSLQPVFPVSLYTAYGHVLKSSGAVSEALVAYNKGLELAARRLQPDNEEYGRLHLGLGNCYFEMQQWAESEAHFRKSLAIYEAAGASKHTLFNVYMGLALCYSRMFNSEAALAIYRKLEAWIPDFPETDVDRYASRLYTRIGLLYEIQGNFTTALDYLNRANAAAQKFYGYYHAATSYALYYTGVTNLYMERFEPALDYFKKALTIADSIWKKPTRYHIDLYLDIATAFCRMERFTEADHYWKKAEKDNKQLEGADMSLYIHLAQGEVALYMKRYEETIPQYEKALAIMDSLQFESSGDKAYIFTVLSVACNKVRGYSKALEYAQKALEINTKPAFRGVSAGELPDSAYIINGLTLVVLHEKAQALYLLGRDSAAAPSVFSEAWAICKQAIRINEHARRHFFSLKAQNYDPLQLPKQLSTLGMALLYQQYTISGQNQYIEQAFQLAEQSKAVSLIEKAREVDAKQFAGIPDSLLATERQLKNEIARYENLDRAEDPARSDSLLFALKHRQIAFMKEMERNFPKYYQLKYEAKPVDLSALRTELPKDAMLVSYFIDQERSCLYIFTVAQQQNITCKRVPLTEQAEKSIKKLRNLLQSVKLSRDAQRAEFIQHSNAWYRQLIEPIADQIADKKRLILIPDGFLHYLPFEVLLKSNTNAPFHQLDYFVRQVEISYQYAAALFVRQNRAHESAHAKDILAFAPVFFPGASDTIAPSQPDSVGKRAYTFSPLPYSEQEVKGIAKVNGAQGATLLLREAATETSLKNALQQPYRIAHLAGHSFANIDDPDFSGIACARPVPDEDDGILHTHEIYNLSIPADLVVLSSCESGLGALEAGEGLLGLHRAFAYAGAPNIIYTLWKINDKVSSELMIEFYRSRSKGLGYGAALRAAKLKALSAPATASPGLWSGFLLLGQ